MNGFCIDNKREGRKQLGEMQQDLRLHMKLEGRKKARLQPQSGSGAWDSATGPVLFHIQNTTPMVKSGVASKIGLGNKALLILCLTWK